MPYTVFDFESEFSILDLGATTSLLKTGSIRPSLLLFTEDYGVEAVSLNWNFSTGDNRPVASAIEDSRRFARDRRPQAYGFVAQFSRGVDGVEYYLPSQDRSNSQSMLGIAMLEQNGGFRGVTYPVKAAGSSLSLGAPTVEDELTSDWCSIGDIWVNPFCKDDLVRFKPNEKAVDPTSTLWQSIVELTRLRMHDDQAHSNEYMAFLDDLRNGIFLVDSRSETHPDRVMLKSRTTFNPIGLLEIEANRLLLVDSMTSEIESV